MKMLNTSSKTILWFTVFILQLCAIATANVEKIVFLAPKSEARPQDASIDNLLLTSLSEANPSVRTRINASFPSPSHPQGEETWMLLEGLKPGRRYEVRICWLATVRAPFRYITLLFNTNGYSNQLLFGFTIMKFNLHSTIQH